MQPQGSTVNVSTQLRLTSLLLQLRVVLWHVLANHSASHWGFS